MLLPLGLLPGRGVEVPVPDASLPDVPVPDAEVPGLVPRPLVPVPLVPSPLVPVPVEPERMCVLIFMNSSRLNLPSASVSSVRKSDAGSFIADAPVPLRLLLVPAPAPLTELPGDVVLVPDRAPVPDAALPEVAPPLLLVPEGEVSDCWANAASGSVRATAAATDCERISFFIVVLFRVGMRLSGSGDRRFVWSGVFRAGTVARLDRLLSPEVTDRRSRCKLLHLLRM